MKSEMIVNKLTTIDFEFQQQLSRIRSNIHTGTLHVVVTDDFNLLGLGADMCDALTPSAM